MKIQPSRIVAVIFYVFLMFLMLLICFSRHILERDFDEVDILITISFLIVVFLVDFIIHFLVINSLYHKFRGESIPNQTV